MKEFVLLFRMDITNEDAQPTKKQMESYMQQWMSWINEIAENGWLTCPATSDLLFDTDIDRKYDRILASIGVNLAHLSQTAGHA